MNSVYEVLPITKVKNNDILIEHGGLFRVFNKKVSKAHSPDEFGETIYFESEYLGPYKGSIVSIPAHWRTKDRPWIVQGNKNRSARRIKKTTCKELKKFSPQIEKENRADAKRGSNPSSRKTPRKKLFVVAKVKGNDVRFLTASSDTERPRWTLTKGEAIKSTTMNNAKHNALVAFDYKTIATGWYVIIVASNKSIPSIIKEVNKLLVKA